MKYFSIPADFKTGTIDRYYEMNKAYKNSRVAETYGNITIGNKFGSGRAVNQLPAVDLLDLKKYIEYSQDKGIGFNYTINATHLGNKEFTGEGVLEIKEFLSQLHGIGVRLITAALPPLIEIIESLGCDFEIKASTLCQITNVNKAVAFKNKGVSRMVVDESINRNIKILRRIREEFGGKVELIINPICLKDCIYRMFHYNQITEDSTGISNKHGVNFYEHRCVLQRHGNIGNVLRICFLRPEDLEYYSGIGINYFKLQGRHLVLVGDPVRTVKAYFDESFAGDLMDLIYMFQPQNSFKIPIDNKKLDDFIKPFLTKDDFCKRDCTACQYCDRYAKKIIDYNEAQRIIDLARDFYAEYDGFNKMLKTVNTGEEQQFERNEEKLEFDL